MAHVHPGVYSIDTTAYHSKMRHVNPALKTVAALAVLIITLWADSLWVSGFVILSLAFVTVTAGGMRVRTYLRLFSIPVVFILLGSLAIAWQVTEEPVGLIALPFFHSYLVVTVDSLMQMLHAAGRAFGGVSSLYFLTLTTPVAQLLALLQKWHCPMLLTELMYLIYRYIFILEDTREQMNAAAKSRSGDRNFRTACRTFGKVMGNLLFVSLRQADRCYDAMESRCYEGKLRFLEEENPVRPRQIAAVAGYLALLGLILAAGG